MLDAAMRKLIDPPLNRLGQEAAKRGITADAVTLLGLALGILAALIIALGAPLLALLPLLLHFAGTGWRPGVPAGGPAQAGRAPRGSRIRGRMAPEKAGATAGRT